MTAAAVITTAAKDTAMVDTSAYLERISAFSRVLRHEGLAIGLHETEDAVRVLLNMDLDDRDLVKAALRTVFASSREEQASFDRAFDNFFVSEQQIKKRIEEQLQQQEQVEQVRRQAQEALQVNGEEMHLSENQRETYCTMSEEARSRLRRFMETYKDAAARSPDLYNNFIHSVFTKVILEEQMRMEDAALGCEEIDPDIGLLYRDISKFKDIEIPRAISIIQTISQQINGELSAKRNSRGHSGKLDFRRTIRKGLETGGSFYRLKYKKKRQRKKHLVLLCDVSGSMVQFSEFALRFVQALNHISESSKVFLFSEEVFEADAFSLQNMDLFRDYVRTSGLYGKGTDLGLALSELTAKRPPVLNDSTTLLILSDSKTVDQQRALRTLLEAKRLAGRVIWLNPIPESKWQYIKSAQAFSTMCTMVSCSTLGALAAACRRIAD